MPLTVGELARRCGLTVRTLHHYDAIGLLKPSLRSDAGFRLYDRTNVERLHRIQALRQLGLPLADIGTVLSGTEQPLAELIDRQIAAKSMRRTSMHCRKSGPSPQPSPRRGEGVDFGRVKHPGRQPTRALSPPGRGLG